MRALSRTALVASTGLILGTSALAQATRVQLPFPMDAIAQHEAIGELELAPRLPEVRDLVNYSEVELAGLPLPDGRSVDLELTRIDLDRMGFGIEVNGTPRPDALSALDLSVWRGTVAGDPSSDVVVSFSAYGSRGWVHSGGELVHLIARPGPNKDWSVATMRVTTEQSLNQRGARLGEFCLIDEVEDLGPVRAEEDAGFEMVEPDTLLVEISVETDFQLFQLFGNLNAEMAYVTTLLGAISDRYNDEIDVVLGYPYLQFYTNSNDPWTAQNQGASAMLHQFRTAWSTGIPNNGDLGHFVSGANLGGGVAWLGQLCNAAQGFAVSGNISGQVNFPVTQGSGNWDFMVIAHEIGHNFNAPHTHEFCPTPLDQCAPSSVHGPCQNQTICTNTGTIMSYCHLCSGGTSNVMLEFHPFNRSRMRNHAMNANCADVLCESPENFCNAKVNSNFCGPVISYVGVPSTTDTGPFRIIGNDIMPNEFGILVYGTNGPFNLAFHNGTLCVKPPFNRVLPPKNSGSTGSGFCPGELRRDFNKTIQSGVDPLLSAGAVVHTQWFYRDPGVDAFNDGLTDGLSFQICP